MTDLDNRVRLERLARLRSRRTDRLQRALDGANRAVTVAQAGVEDCQARLAACRSEREKLHAWQRQQAGADAVRWRDVLAQRDTALRQAADAAKDKLNAARREREKAIERRNAIARACQRAGEHEAETRLQLARVNARIRARGEERIADDLAARNSVAGVRVIEGGVA